MKKTQITIEDFQRHAASRGGRCLTTEYSNLNQRMLFECSKGHRWETAGKNARGGTWCPECCTKFQRIHSIEDFRQLAAERGGRCLSTEYTSIAKKLMFECSKGHQWEMPASHVKAGCWCPECSIRPKLTLADFQRLAAGRGGRCLSVEYVNTKRKLLFECSKGHVWEATGGSVRDGTWCPVCSGRRSA